MCTQHAYIHSFIYTYIYAYIQTYRQTCMDAYIYTLKTKFKNKYKTKKHSTYFAGSDQGCAFLFDQFFDGHNFVFLVFRLPMALT